MTQDDKYHPPDEYALLNALVEQVKAHAHEWRITAIQQAYTGDGSHLLVLRSEVEVEGEWHGNLFVMVAQDMNLPYWDDDLKRELSEGKYVIWKRDGMTKEADDAADAADAADPRND